MSPAQIVWPHVPLAQLCDIKIGRTPERANAEYWGPGYPWLSIADMQQGKNLFVTKETITPKAVDECRCYQVQPGTLLMSFKLSVGKLGFARIPMYTNEAIAALLIRDQTDVLADYLYYALQVVDLISGTDRAVMGRTLNTEKLNLLPIPLPSIPEQKQLITILDKADRLHRQCRYALELSNTYLQSVFLEMFGDPATNPKGWEIRPLRSIALKFSDGPFGSNLKTEHYTSSGVRVIRLQNIGIGQLIDEDKTYISESHFASLDKHACLPSDVIVGTLGDPNLRACILPDSIPIALNKADCVQIRVKPEEATTEYICWLLNMPQTLYMATGMIHGQTRTRINMGRLAELQVPIPPLPLQHKFAQIVQRFEHFRAQQLEALRQAEHLFQTLLHQAFQGEFELRSAAVDMPPLAVGVDDSRAGVCVSGEGEVAVYQLSLLVD